jgi:undecaprenyl diphosphate synthase
MEPLPAHSSTRLPPRHIAIIMDGNGRWAKARGLPRTEGHRRGMASVRKTVQGAIDLGVGYLTLYGFSSENWNRPAGEVKDLMGLLRVYLRREVADLHKNGVRLRFIGDRSRLASDIVALLAEGERMTARNGGLTLVLAINYGSHAEIIGAVRRIAADAAAGVFDARAIDEALFHRYLETAEIPDPDLLIRTSGEQRLSNFLLWQAAYAELVFVDTLWPDFNKDSLQDAVHEFQRRERRYGASSS